MKPSSLLIGLSLAFSGSAFSQDDLGIHNRIDWIMKEYDLENGPGAVVAVVSKGQIIFSKAYGLANVEHGIPNSTSTVFDIASLAKQFGAMSIALLIYRGQLSLEDDIREYLPEFPDFGHVITIRHLIYHMSGLRDWPGNLAIGGWQMDDVISFRQIMRMVENQQHLNFEPGTEFLYSNTGYNLLAEIVTRVSGQSFIDWTQKHIFQPLGMTNTRFQDNHTELVFDKAYGYLPYSNRFIEVNNDLSAMGSSSLLTNVRDLAKWVNCLDEGKLGGKTVVNLMHEQGVLNNGETVDYGFGNFITGYKGLRRVAHYGSWAGFSTYLARFPEKELSVIILSNRGNSSPSSAAMKIADLYLDNQIAKPNSFEEKLAADPASGMEPERILLEQYAGSYQVKDGQIVNFILEGKKLKVLKPGEPIYDLIQLSENLFKIDMPGRDDTISFHLNHEAGVSYATLHQKEDILLKRIKYKELTPKQLAYYEGRFYSLELATSYFIRVKEGNLIAKHFRNGDIFLGALEEDTFHSDTWFFQRVKFKRDAMNKIEGFLVSCGGVRNVWFAKVME